jgi:uncharacterized protein YbjT (DUF2867 family)
MNILVAGATGYVGSLLVPKLITKEHSVRCLARNPEKAKSLFPEHVEVVKGDVLSPETLKDGMKGIDVAYYLVHAMGAWGDFKKRDALSASNFGNAAARAGVKRIIYLGGLGKEDDNLLEEIIDGTTVT